jgi:hypothetical protein
LVAGDLLLSEVPGGPMSDIIRFNSEQNGGSLVLYSDNTDGAKGASGGTLFPSWTNFWPNLRNPEIELPAWRARVGDWVRSMGRNHFS